MLHFLLNPQLLPVQLQHHPPVVSRVYLRLLLRPVLRLL
jgi:hypothetical protein